VCSSDLEEDGTLEEDSIAYPIINTNTQA
jgi:hypothetical protein